jgi:pantetheine-phosphate adenylyltransferase
MTHPKHIGVYPGTFDPITVGHLDIITRGLRVVDQLILGVAEDTGKTPIFTLEERAGFAREAIAEVLGAEARRVTVVPFSGLLVNLAREHQATLIIRGLRAVSDYEYEFQMACMNSKLAPEVETVFLTASEATHFISSRFVKQIARLGGDVSQFVPPSVNTQLKAYFSQGGNN